MHNKAMANTYLTVPFKDKDAAKALGARWDGVQRQWFVPEGRDLVAFTTWLPTGDSFGLDSTESSCVVPFHSADTALAAPKKGVTLSTLLACVSQAVAQAYRAGVWVLVEVVELRTNGGHVFLGVSERDSGGSVLAKTSAVIWQSTADAILPGSKGLKSPLMCLTQARYGISWGVLGAAMACFEEAVSYAKTRVMFDKPIGGFQIQQVRLADMLTELTKAQLVSLHLGRLKDAGNFTPTQVSLAKRNNVSIATDIAREARRLLGGNGILAE